MCLGKDASCFVFSYRLSMFGRLELSWLFYPRINFSTSINSCYINIIYSHLLLYSVDSILWSLFYTS